MATPTASKRGLKATMASNSWIYVAYVILITAAAIVLMVVPSKEMNDASADAKLQLDTTFSDLVSQPLSAHTILLHD